MDVPGDSFEERWSNLEERVRSHCADVGWAYPDTTLQLVRPWFASIGDWFDRAAPKIEGRHPIQVPGSDDPALVILREFDSLLSRLAEAKEGESVLADRRGLPGEYEYDVGTLRHPDSRLLDVLEGDEYPLPLRREAASALTAFLDLTRSPVHKGRWPRVKKAVRERADREGKDPKVVLTESVEEAVWVEFVHFVRQSRSVKVDVSDSDIPRDSFVTSVDVVAVLTRNLIPGKLAPDLWPNINEWVTEDMLGPGWRDEERDPETEAKTRLHARNMWHRTPDPRDQILRDHVVEDLLSHDSLSDRQREALRLEWQEGLDAGEIGERLGCSRSTARTHLQRGHQKLRELGS